MHSQYLSFQKIGKALFVLAVSAALLAAPMFQSNLQAAPDLAQAKDFYKGKVLNFVVPHSPGGGFDTYARAIGKFMQDQIPELKVVIRNMPGSGGIMGTTKVYNAKPDGTVIMIIDGIGCAFAQILDEENTKFDMAKFSWIGRVSAEPPLIAVGNHTPYKTVQDFINAKKPVTFAQRGAADADYFGAGIICNALEIPYRNVVGFGGSGESILAVERKDLDAVELSVSTMLPHVKSGSLIPMIQLASKRDPRVPDIPTIMELAPEKEKEILKAVVNVLALDRSLCAPPGVPEDRLQLLRETLKQIYADPKFQEWSKNAKRPINPLDGDELSNVVGQSLGLRDKLKPLFEEVLEQGKVK